MVQENSVFKEYLVLMLPFNVRGIKGKSALLPYVTLEGLWEQT